MLPHRRVQRLLPSMPKRWMANVVHQRQRLDQIGVEPELPGNCPRNLGHFNRVRKPVAEMIRVSPREDLGLRLQPTEGASMYDAITIALKIVAVRMRRLRMAAAARLLHPHRIVSEHAKSLPAEAGLASRDNKGDRAGGKCVKVVRALKK